MRAHVKILKKQIFSYVLRQEESQRLQLHRTEINQLNRAGLIGGSNS